MTLTVFLCACESNPANNSVAAQIVEAAKRATPVVTQGSASNAPPGSAAITQGQPTSLNKSLKTPGQQQGAISEKNDPTGLIGKVITPNKLPKNPDVTMSSYGNNYYFCGGSVFEGNTQITKLRKGIKTTCLGNTTTVALTKSSNNNLTDEFLDVMEVLIPKGYELKHGSCKGAAIALSKYEDVKVLTKHLKAWKLENNKFVPVANLKSVSCENEGYGI